ncbi:DUF883 family protein [Ponticoccus gilvus]|nr:DUF883 family protein [Enemella evansiae]
MALSKSKSNGIDRHADFQAVKKQLQNAAAEAQEAVRHSAAEAEERLRDATRQAQVLARDTYAEGSNRAMALRDEVETGIRRNPGLAIAGAVGGGVLLGLLLSRRR